MMSENMEVHPGQIDSMNRLTGIANSAGGTIVSSRGYQCSSVNLRTAITNKDNSYWTNGYNARHEVTASKRHWSDTSPVAGQQYAFACDGIGNRLTKMDCLVSGPTGQHLEFTYDWQGRRIRKLVKGILRA